jgi:hypothetical protein
MRFSAEGLPATQCCAVLQAHHKFKRISTAHVVPYALRLYRDANTCLTAVVISMYHLATPLTAFVVPRLY